MLENSCKVKVTLFDLFGQHVDNELNKADKDNTFVIISCARVGRYEGDQNSFMPANKKYASAKYFITMLPKMQDYHIYQIIQQQEFL